MRVPDKVALKRAEDFKLIGTPAKRLDTPSKVNGTAVYGIDARPQGVRIATLAQSPVFGGRVKSVDDSAAKAVKGVRQIVLLDDAVADRAPEAYAKMMAGKARMRMVLTMQSWFRNQHRETRKHPFSTPISQPVVSRRDRSAASPTPSTRHRRRTSLPCARLAVL
jgi:hypothetical protein